MTARLAIAFLGLGNMGAADVGESGWRRPLVRGFDPVPAAASAAADKGATVFDTAAEAVAEADVVITMLPNGEVVKRCYAEVLPGRTRRARCSSTAPPSRSTMPARRTNWPGRTVWPQLDAPVSGGVKGATAGTLAFMVGGEADALERARPVLEPMAGKIIHCGAAGAGQAAKVCNNMVLAVQQIAVGEAFVLAEKLGLSAQSLFDVITGATGNCWAVHTNCPVPGPVPTSPANNDFKPGFATALMNKDLGLAMDAVTSTGSAAPLGTHAAEIYAKFAVRRLPRRYGLQRGHRNAAAPRLSRRRPLGQKSPALRRSVSMDDTSACDSAASIPISANTCSLSVTVASSTVERPSSVICTSVVRPSVGCGTRCTSPSASSRRIACVTLVT